VAVLGVGLAVADHIDSEPGDVATRLREVLASVSLRHADAEAVEVLIAAGEWAIALETLCTQAYEFDITISGLDRERIRLLGERTGVDTERLLGDGGTGGMV
jgi:hypothetical protein